MTPFSPVNYMQALRELQGLVFACMRLSSEDALVMLERGHLPASHGHNASTKAQTGISQEIALSAKLILQDFSYSPISLPDDAWPDTVAGQRVVHAVLAQVQCVIPKPVAKDGAYDTFGDCVSALAYSSYEQVLDAHDLCLRLLLASLSPANAFTLMHVGRMLNVHTLHRCALAHALAYFSATLESDPHGWRLLSEADLLMLLGHDRLQVSSEVQVFEAVATWAEAYAANPITIPISNPNPFIPAYNSAASFQSPPPAARRNSSGSAAGSSSRRGSGSATVSPNQAQTGSSTSSSSISPSRSLGRVMASLVARVVRLEGMSLRQLEEMDSHPRTLSSPELTRLIAQSYVCRIMGVKPSSLTSKRTLHGMPTLMSPGPSSGSSSRSSSPGVSHMNLADDDEEFEAAPARPRKICRRLQQQQAVLEPMLQAAV